MTKAFDTSLGERIGVSVQAYDADLGGIAALVPVNDDVLQRKAGSWTNRTMAQLLADLGITGYQPLDSDLTAIAALTTTLYGRALLELADATALRSTAGLVIGTNVAPVASPAFTGNPTCPTQDHLTVSDTRIASTEFVNDVMGDFTGTFFALLDSKEPLGELAGINTQTASYTLALTDKGKAIEMNVASANNLTVPLNATVAFPVKSRIDITQVGAGQTTVVATGGVTIRQRETKLKLTGQYSVASLYKRATDEWVLFGDLSA